MMRTLLTAPISQPISSHQSARSLDACGKAQKELESITNCNYTVYKIQYRYPYCNNFTYCQPT